MKSSTETEPVYTIEPDKQHRIIEFVNGVPIWGVVTAYYVKKDGKRLTVAFEKVDVPLALDCPENCCCHLLT